MSKKIRKSFVFEANGHQVRIDNYFNSYRTGFSHTSKLFVDGYYKNECVCGYINRTWECYDYQSSARGAIANSISEISARLKEHYKAVNGIQRMTKTHAEKFAHIVNTNENIVTLREADEKLAGYSQNFKTVWY